MYKIQFLLAFMLLGSAALFAQQNPSRQTVAIPDYLTRELQTDRKTVFTVHLLTDQVETGQKHEYDVLIGGQKVSLPYPNPFQIQNL